MAKAGTDRQYTHGPHHTSYSSPSGGDGDDDYYPMEPDKEEERYSYICGICGAGAGEGGGYQPSDVGYSSIELKELEKKAFMICRSCRRELVWHIEARRIEKEYYKVLYQRLPGDKIAEFEQIVRENEQTKTDS